MGERPRNEALATPATLATDAKVPKSTSRKLSQDNRLLRYLSFIKPHASTYQPLTAPRPTRVSEKLGI